MQKNDLYYVNRHACYLLQFHLVVITKYRHPVIVGKLKNELLSITHTVFEEQWGLHIIEVNTDKDHIHILFESSPQTQLSKLINNYKTVSSRLIRKQFVEELKPYYWKPYFWSDTYFITTVSERSTEIVEQYIRDQGR